MHTPICVTSQLQAAPIGVGPLFWDPKIQGEMFLEFQKSVLFRLRRMVVEGFHVGIAIGVCQP